MNATHKPTTIRYYSNLPRVEPVVIDHSSEKLYKECPRKFFFRVVLGYQAKYSNIILVWGSAYHKFREVLEKTYQHYNNDPDKQTESFKCAVQAAIDYWKKHAQPNPVGTDYDFMTFQRFILSLEATFNYWKDEKKKNKIKVVAIEQMFSIVLDDGIETCGRIDQIVRWGARLWIRDFKTSTKNSSFYERYLSPNDQVMRYMYAAGKLINESVQGAFLEILYNTKQKGPEIYEKTTSRSSEQLKEWLGEQTYWHHRLIESREKDEYPMNESQCAFCPFHKICQGSSEAARLNILKSSYKFEPWDPLSHET